jgi:hypothetical protein
MFYQLFLVQPNQINFTPGTHLLPAYNNYSKKAWNGSGYLKSMVNIFFTSSRNLVTKAGSRRICQRG